MIEELGWKSHWRELRSRAMWWCTGTFVCAAVLLTWSSTLLHKLLAPLSTVWPAPTVALGSSRSLNTLSMQREQRMQSTQSKHNESSMQNMPSTLSESHGAYAVEEGAPDMGSVGEPALYLLDPWEGFQLSLTLTTVGTVFYSVVLGLYHLSAFLKRGMTPVEWTTWSTFISYGLVGFFGGFGMGWGSWGPLTFVMGQAWGWNEGVWLPHTRALFDRLLQMGLASGFLMMALGLFLAAFRTRWLTLQHIAHLRKPLWVLLWLIAALLSPPDVLSQVIMAIPTLLLLEGGLLILAMRHRYETTTRSPDPSSPSPNPSSPHELAPPVTPSQTSPGKGTP